MSAMNEPSSTAGEPTAEHNPATQRPRGYTLADEEMERIAQKLESGDVLDPIALDDPVGQSVEKVIMRVGIAVTTVLIVGLLLAQVMCKNLQLAGIPDFSRGANVESLDDAIRNGILWGGEIVRFPGDSVAVVGEQADTVIVMATNTSARTLEQLVAASQHEATALAMNVFCDPKVSTVAYVVSTTVDPETGAFDAGSNHLEELLTVTWRRSETSDTFVCSISGFEPAVATSKAAIDAQ